MIKDYINQEKHSFPLSLLQDSYENDNQEIVYLKDALQSIHKQAGILPCVIGKSIDGYFFFDLAQAHHVLIAGDTGAGKSVLLHSIILSLLYRKRPDKLQFVFIDPKKVEFGAYNRIGNYLAKIKGVPSKVITDTKEAMAVLEALCDEAERRYLLLVNAWALNFEEYNRQPDHSRLPHIVVVIDEYADLMFMYGQAFESKIRKLSYVDNFGIHLIITTQRPTVSAITGCIKANFVTRIAFRVAREFDSIVILDGKEATDLSCAGDMVYSERNTCVRLRGTHVSKQDIEKVTKYIESTCVE